MRSFTVPVIIVIVVLIVVGLIGGFMESSKPLKIRNREPLILSDEQRDYTPQKVKRMKVKVKRSESPIYLEIEDDEDTYEIEDALESLRKENRELKEILEKYGNRVEDELNDKEFWSTKNR